MLFLLHDLPPNPSIALFIGNVSIVSHYPNIFNKNSSGSIFILSVMFHPSSNTSSLHLSGFNVPAIVSLKKAVRNSRREAD
jgi:hypothetical protein